MVETTHDQEDDARDPRVAALLEVLPLDDITRRRLVAAALRAPKPVPRSRVLLGAAAALVVVVTSTVFAVAVTDDAGNDTVAAKRSPAAESARSGIGAAPATVRDLGTFGDVADGDQLARLKAATRQAKSTGESTGASAGSLDVNPAPSAADTAGAAKVVTRLESLRCADGLPQGTVAGVGKARYRGADAIVVLTRRDDGSTSLDAVVTDPCEVHHLA